MSLRVHAPFLVPGWEMCLPSIDCKTGTSFDGAANYTEAGIQERDICTLTHQDPTPIIHIQGYISKTGPPR